jgi:hypothetical protein
LLTRSLDLQRIPIIPPPPTIPQVPLIRRAPPILWGLGWVLVFAGWFGGQTAWLPAQVTVERFDRFLNAAMDRGFYDAAEYYLETLEREAGTAAKIRSEIPFRRAQLLFEKTRTLTNLNEVRQAWSEAIEIAREQIGKADNLERRLQAIQLMTQIHGSLAEYQRRQAQVSWERLAEAADNAAEARRELEQAAVAYEQGAAMLLEELRESRRSTDQARRDTFESNTGRFLSHLLSRVMTMERIAFTYPRASAEFKQQMEALIQLNTEYAGKYRQSPPYDSYFQLYRIRGLINLDRWQEATPLIDDVLILEGGMYRQLKRDVVLLGNELWFREPPYKIELALAQLEKCDSEMTPADRATETGQRITLALAKAHHQRSLQAATVERPTPEQRSAANLSSRKRGELLRQLVKLDSFVANEARELLAEWGMRGPAEKTSEVSTFAEAKQIALDLLVQGIELKGELSQLSDSESAAPEQQERRNEMLALADQSLQWLDRSLELATAETRRVERNMVRLYQCQAYWLKDYFLETALIGQFLLDRFPNELGTPEAAALAAQALNRLVSAGKAAGNPVDVEQRQMVHICQQVLQRWPEQKETGDVAFMLIATELDRQNFADALDVLRQLAPGNPRRSMSELRIGIALLQEAERIGNEESPAPEQVEQRNAWRSQAQPLLVSALANESQELTSLHFVGAAALAQLLNGQGKYQEALGLLEQPPTAALPRLEQGDPLLSDINLQTSLLQSSVIAYMGRLGQTGDIVGTTDRVAGLLGLLQERLQSHPRATQILQSYYALTLKNLREQAAGQLTAEARQNLGLATVRIFEPILAPSEDWRLVATLGETLLDLSEKMASIPAGGAGSSPRGPMLDLAAQSYEKALRLTAGPSSDPALANFRLSFQVKLAAALRGQGKYETAQSKLNELLTGQSKNSLIQIELCKLYQTWGIAAKNQTHLRTALMGQGRGTAAEMWGWQKLAQATISDTKNRGTFYEALFGMATCRFEFGKLAADPKYVEAALKVIKDQYERDPTMGGAMWHDRFNRLTQEIQQHLKRPANGLTSL